MLAPVLAAAFGVLAPDAGLPTPEPVDLIVSFPSLSPSCPTLDALEDAVTQRLGANPFRAGAHRSLHVVGRKEGNTWIAELELREDAKVLGRQRLNSTSVECAALEPMLVLTISVVCGASPAVAPNAQGDIEKQFSVIPGAAPPGPAEPVAGDDSSGPRAWVGGGALVTTGAAPLLAVGGTVEIEAVWRRFSLGIQGRADLPATKTLAVGQLQTNLLYGAMLPCGRSEQWSGCALIALGSEIASGSGYPNATTASSFYAGLGLQARFDLPLSVAWEIRFHADLIAPLTRGIVQVQKQTVWEVPPVSFGLGVEVLGALP